jgi:hypothetical protein
VEDERQALAAELMASSLSSSQCQLFAAHCQSSHNGRASSSLGYLMAYGHGESQVHWYSYARVRCGAQEVCWQLVDTAIGTEVSRLQAHPPACVTSTW